MGYDPKQKYRHAHSYSSEHVLRKTMSAGTLTLTNNATYVVGQEPVLPQK